jgi:hypothetical protein
MGIEASSIPIYNNIKSRAFIAIQRPNIINNNNINNLYVVLILANDLFVGHNIHKIQNCINKNNLINKLFDSIVNKRFEKLNN